MKSRFLAQSLLIASIGAILATAAGAADGDLPDPQLKFSREIESPVKRAPAGSSGTPSAPASRAHRC